ncbi:MAG: radical SAM/SPASM domain-containing protein [Candidatus Aenigmatarchaeota archaeon]
MDKKDIGLRLLSYYTNLPLSKPEMINIGLTHGCNLDCSICNTRVDSPNFKEHLKQEQLKRLIGEIGEWGDIGVSFAGGEPLLRKNDLIESIKIAKEKNLTTYMTTNGILINDGVAAEIVGSGLDFISVSLDGIRKDTNDEIRDDGSYNGVKRALDNLLKWKKRKSSDLKIGITTVVTSKNLDELVDIHDLVLERDLHEVNYNPYVPDNSFMGKVDYEGDEFWVHEDEMDKLKEVTEDLLDIKRSVNGRIGSSEFLLRNMPEYFEKKEEFHKGKCLAGQSYMYIKPNGNVDVCGKGPSFDLRPMNVKERSIKGIWRSINFFITRLKIKNCKRPCLMLCFPKVSVKNFLREVVK